MLRSMLCMLLSGGQGLNVVYAAQRGTGTEYSPKLPWIGVALADLFVINRPVSPGQLSHPTALRRYALEGQDRGRGACLCWRGLPLTKRQRVTVWSWSRGP